MCSSWRGLALAIGILGLTVGTASAAAAAETVSLDVTVVRVSDEPGGVKGAGAQRAAGILGKEIRYQSLEVLESKRPKVPVNEVWKLRLPTGKHLVLRLLGVNDQGALVAVDIEKSARGDFRLRSGKPVVIGGESYDGGKLVIILEAQ